MNTQLQTIRPNFIEFEGFYYLEFEGEFYKGCKRCGGEGHYKHNGEHDLCYTCDNTSAKLGEQLPSEAAAQKWCHVRALAKANRERKAEEARLAKVAKMEAKQAALKESDADVYEFLMAVDLGDHYFTYEEWAANVDNGEKNPFVRAMAEALRFVSAADRPFTAHMISTTRKAMEDRIAAAAADAAKPAIVEGRIVITGKVVSTKVVEGDYGTSYKMLVEDAEGRRVYGSIPSSFWSDIDGSVLDEIKGRTVTFTGTVEASKDDKSFGFFKRPTKATIAE